MGASRELLSHIASITDLAGQVSKIPEYKVTADFQQRRNDLERSLHGLQQTSRSNDSELETIAETKRLCALIYLHARVNQCSPYAQPISRLKDEVVILLKRLPAKGTLLWTFFILGTLAVHGEDDRRFILDSIQTLLDARPLSSIRKARNVIIAVWRDRDLGIKPQSWESLVQDRGGQLSLA